MKNIYVILVEPVYKGNVGAIARLMHNFECDNLRIVGSIPQKEDYYLAVHSEDILDKVVLFENLENAIVDMDRTIALSRRKGSKKITDLVSTQLVEYLKDSKNLKIGLIFGRETYGLADSEAELCDLRCYIDANNSFPSLNLAQAVTVILYEIYNAYKLRENIEIKKYEENQQPAPKESIIDSVDYVIDVLKGINIFKNQEDIANIQDFFKHIFYKANATKQMTIDLKKIFNRIHLSFYGKGKGYKHNEDK
ncbi:MAG: RNA methyltransferase [Candidatus Cloacimonetes bacterium]|jgi:tRNA (cytidine32/uridine32-2'-O)-methyltransferase|nr:RNA methyltransferase [Candidatus Cloacimonadota bacterium]MDD4155559.1 RNA methyltransferase [Candidatus Cloacimonadota bacterium]